MDNRSSSSTPYFWRSESEATHISESIAHLNLSLQPGVYEEITNQPSQELPMALPMPGIYCNMAALMPSLSVPHTIHAAIANEPEEAMHTEEATINKRSRSSTLAQLLIDELEDVSDDIFFETKWKIIDILREAQKKQRSQLAFERLMRDRLSSTSSPSIITLPSPSPSSTSPLLSEWGYEEQN